VSFHEPPATHSADEDEYILPFFISERLAYRQRAVHPGSAKAMHDLPCAKNSAQENREKAYRVRELELESSCRPLYSELGALCGLGEPCGL
jgi:hypothetical protein